MNKISRVVFWQVSPSIHQAPYIKNLTKYCVDLEIICVLQRDINDERKSLGWTMPNYGDATILKFENDRSELIHIYEKFREDAAHIFSSVIDSENIRHVYEYSLRNKPALIGYLSEGYDAKGIKGLIRKVRRQLYEKRLLQHLEFIFSIGNRSYHWFEKCGISKENIFPFPYVVESVPQVSGVSNKNNIFKIVFVGALIKRKNVSMLLNALSRLSHASWELDIIGSGPQLPLLESMVDSLNLTRKVKFRGSINNADVIKEISKNDLLVLPSLWDGWGAVVNEALSQGVQVICSDQCGSSELIVKGSNGDVFKLSDEASLVNSLHQYLSRGPICNETRQKIIDHSKKFNGESVANYFINVIQYMSKNNDKRPEVPWRC